jgi:hypothetical protein
MAAIINIKNGGYQPHRADINFNSDATIANILLGADGQPLEPGTTAMEWSTATPPLAVALWEFLGPAFGNQWGKIATF